MPPEWMWTLPEDLEEWWDAVEQRHKEKYGGDDDDGDLDPRDGQIVENEFAEAKRRHSRRGR